MTNQAQTPQADAMKRILIVEDYPVVVWGLQLLINDQPDLMVCGAATNSTQLTSNAWSYVTVTYTNSTVKFYVNGLLTDTLTKTYTMGSNNKAYSISTSAQSFDGKLDDMRYYNRALSDADVAGIYGETSTNRVCMADALGSIVALTDTGKVIQTEYDYEPFGATTTSGAASANPYKFTAREDDGTGLYFYRARYYHPVLGRFMSEDPLGMADGPHMYAYAGSNPLLFADPLGLKFRYKGKYRKDYNRVIDCWKKNLPKDSQLRKIVEDLDASPDDYVLDQLRGGATVPTTRSRNWVAKNEGPSTTGIDTKSYTIDSKTWSFAEALAHELLHAHDFWKKDGSAGREHPEWWNEISRQLEREAKECGCE